MKTQRKNKGKKQQKRTTKVDENKNQQTANPPNEQLSNASQPTNEAHTGEKNREQQTNNIPDELSVGAPITNPNISCYVNSIIQALAHCPILCDAIRASLNNEKCRDANTPPLTRAVEQVIALIHQQPASATPINISRFYDEALPIVFKGQYDLDVQQQDANEFLFSLVEALEKEWNEHKNLSTKHILEPFQCSWSYIRQCTACNHTDTVSYKDHYNNVGLDILQDKYLLAELYENVFENKEYEGVCENCGKTTNKKQTQIYDHLPNIITVYIKRTVAGKAQNFKTIKTFKKLIYPETFEIGSGGGSDVSSERKTYNLSGVVLHLGKTIQQGHYITLVRDMSKKIGTTDRWWKLDDAEKQREMTESDVLNFHQQVAVLLYSSQALNDSVAKQDAGPMGLGEDKSATVASCHEDTDNNSEKDVAEQRQPVVVNEAPEEEEQQDAMDATAEMVAEKNAKEDRKTCTFYLEGGCKNLAIRGGLCWKHGAKGKKCSMEGCIKFSQMNGICAKHGAKKKRPAPPMCSIKDCNNFAYRKGCCWTHNKDKGELFVCSVDQCKKFAQKDGKCGKHHGSVIKKRKICSYDGCKKFSQVGGRCKTHKQIL